MKSKIISGCVMALLLSISGVASAQSVSLRLEPGVAVPLTSPQKERFEVGAAGAAKLGLGLGSYLSLGPSLQVVHFPSKLDAVDPGNAWSYGGFLRLMRPRDEKNTDTGLAAVSPWVDTDLKLVHTDPLDRLGWSVAVGAQVPTSDSRWLWVGPFVRYDAVNEEDGKKLTNTNSAKTVIAGLSFEFGAGVAKKEVVQPPAPQPPPVEPPVKPVPTPPAPVDEVVMEFRPKVQFAWDSYKLEADQLPALKDVVKAMLADASYHVVVEGHASSEGQVEHNQKLSENRAKAVRDFLVANGVSADRLTVRGFGSSIPVASNNTEAGRVLNRRVEFDVNFKLVKGNK